MSPGVIVAVGLGGLVAVIVAIVIWRRRRRWQGTLPRQLAAISYAQLSGIVLPKADEGFIHLDLVLLVAGGVLVVDTKDVAGAVFGSDRMQSWTVIDGQRRFTFPNPQEALYDRVAAVRQVLRSVPVDGKLIFTSGARFEKGIPAGVVTIDQLLAQYETVDPRSPPPAVRAFMAEWEALARAAVRP